MQVETPRSRFLPKPGSVGYHVLLSAVAILILGPLGGVTAAYMNFSLGFFVGGQVFAGILGSVVTYGYGPEGKHGANYIQTMAASVASMCAMGVLLQAMTWLGLPEPPAWKMIVYYLCIGMFGVGVGMLYTPLLVDKLKLTFPSGLAVANILRALTDKSLLKRSVAQLGGGMGGGFLAAVAAEKIAVIGALGVSVSTVGAGMVVGARIVLPALFVGVIGELITPTLRAHGILGPNDPFRKIGFLFALASILGTALVDLSIIFRQAMVRIRESRAAAARESAKRTPYRADGDLTSSLENAPEEEAWKKTNMRRLVLWVVFWGIALVFVATNFMNLPLGFVLLALALVFVFVLVCGIALGISDSSPISSAFVITVLIMAALGLRDPGVGLLAGGVLLVATSIAGDMQQDRSTGWRLGTSRTVQFRYQVVGVLMGAVLAVVMSKLFMKAYPVLNVNVFDHPEAKVDQWQSAMTYKFVGALSRLKNVAGYQIVAMILGLAYGVVVETLRKILKGSAKYKAFIAQGVKGHVTDLVVDCLILPNAYASSFGGFVEFATTVWFTIGGCSSSIIQWTQERAQARARKDAPSDTALPEDMSMTSLVGGGLIAGDSLAALIFGIIGLLALVK